MGYCRLQYGIYLIIVINPSDEAFHFGRHTFRGRCLIMNSFLAHSTRNYLHFT